MKSAIVFAAIVAAAFIAACAGAPERIEQLEQARAQVQRLSQEPMASEAASRELAAAREALQMAESAQEEGEPQEQIVHFAYLAQRQAETGMARIQEAQAREQITQAEAERNRVLLEARARESQAAQQRAASAEAQARARAQEAESARKELASTQQALESLQEALESLQAEQTERGMVLTLSDVLFDTDKAVLKPGAAPTIDRLAQFLSENEGTRIIIEGHTDSRGPEAYNEELSRRRAQAVAETLIMRGVPSSRFEVVGRGEQLPVASNDTASGRQQNRRVEIIFSDASGKFAQDATSGTLR